MWKPSFEARGTPQVWMTETEAEHFMECPGCGDLTLVEAHAAQEAANLLLQEMSHRVKNKFAMIASIIGIQARNSSPGVKSALEDVAARVNVMATVYNILQFSRHAGLTRDNCSGIVGDASIKAPPNGLGRLTIKIALRQRSQFLICCFFLFEVLSQK